MTSALIPFFSSSREDGEFALRLARDLRAAGLMCGWINSKSNLDNVGAVEDALATCPVRL